MVYGVNRTSSATAITEKSSYPDNLAVIADSADKRSQSYGKYSNKQILEASERLNKQEYLAFGQFSSDASTSGIKKYAEAYIKYYDKLSPEEQNSPRYKGTRESMANLLSQANAQLQSESGNKSEKATQKPTSLLLMLLEDLKKKFDEKRGMLSTNNDNVSGVKVTISEQARSLAAKD